MFNVCLHKTICKQVHTFVIYVDNQIRNNLNRLYTQCYAHNTMLQNNCNNKRTINSFRHGSVQTFEQHTFWRCRTSVSTLLTGLVSGTRWAGLHTQTTFTCQSTVHNTMADFTTRKLWICRTDNHQTPIVLHTFNTTLKKDAILTNIPRSVSKQSSMAHLTHNPSHCRPVCDIFIKCMWSH